MAFTKVERARKLKVPSELIADTYGDHTYFAPRFMGWACGCEPRDHTTLCMLNYILAVMAMAEEKIAAGEFQRSANRRVLRYNWAAENVAPCDTLYVQGEVLVPNEDGDWTLMGEDTEEAQQFNKIVKGDKLTVAEKWAKRAMMEDD